MKKRFWSCFLSLSLLLTMMPTMAFATEDGVNESEGTSEACTVTDGCTLVNGHEGDCVVVEPEEKEPESVPCTLTEGCTLGAGHEGECVVAPTTTLISELKIGEEEDTVSSKPQTLSGDTTIDTDTTQYYLVVASITMYPGMVRALN